MTFTAIVTNEGTGTAAASVLTLAVGGESTPQSFNISSLAPGASQTVTRTETLDVAQAYMNTATADANGDVAESDETNNVTTDTFTVTGASPDLVVTSLTHFPENPTTEDSITFTATVTNEGTGTAAASVLTLAVGGESTPQSFNISSLAPGASQTVTRTETLDVAQAYMNTAAADANGDVAESDETNNVTTDTFTVTGASPDLVVTSLTHSPENPTTEDAMTFTAIVINEGTGTAAASVLTLAVGGESTPQSFNISSLAPGASQTVTRTETLDVAQTYMNTRDRPTQTATLPSPDETNNVTTDTFTVTAVGPDLIVSSFTHSPANPTTGDTITFHRCREQPGLSNSRCVGADPSPSAARARRRVSTSHH